MTKGGMGWRAWLVVLWLGWGMSLGAGAAPLALREASVVTTVDGVASRAAVTLPYNWDHLHRGKAGVATFELAFVLAGRPAQPYTLYFSSLGNAYDIWLNGMELERQGDLQAFNGSDYGQIPRFVKIPAQLLQERNLLRIVIRADAGRHAGLSVPVLGTGTEIEAEYGPRYRWLAMGTVAVMVLSLLVCLLALALWWTQADTDASAHPRRDVLYLFAGLAELSWALRVGFLLVENPPLPWIWWGPLAEIAQGGWVAFTMAFFFVANGWARHRWSRHFFRGLWALLVLGGVAAFVSVHWRTLWPVTLSYGLLAAGALALAVAHGWATVREPNATRVAMAGALVLNTAVGVRDWIVFRLTDSFGAAHLLRYSSVAFGLALGYIVVTRFRAASAQARDLMANLAARVSEKELALQQSYAQVEQLAREQERTAERARILRDMHDGVGSHISAAIRQLQSGKASNEAVLQTLRDSLDQLKLSIDAMHLAPGDVTALLANLRYRLEPRFAASDIALEWAVDLLAPLERLDAHAMRHLQFMVFEALSNVLQHAHASVLRIEAGMQGKEEGGVRLRIIDNGRGFDVRAPWRKGLLSLRERAAAIGALLQLESSAGRTVMEILIPREAAAARDNRGHGGHH